MIPTGLERSYLPRIIVAFLLTGLFLSACGDDGGGEAPAVSEKEGDIVLGVSAPYSGSAGFYGEMFDNGFDMALDDYGNDVDGYEIRLIIEDDACAPDTSVSVVNRLLSRREVQAILGPGCSGGAAAAQQIMADAEMPHLVPGYLPDLTEVGDEFIFRTNTTDAKLMKGLAEFAAPNHGRVAVIHGTDGYSEGLAQAFTESAKEENIDIVSVDTFEQGATDFSGQVARLRDTNAEAIFIGGYEAEMGLLARQTRQSGIELPFFGAAGMANKDFIEGAAGAAEGAVFTNGFALDNPDTKEWVDRYLAKYGESPTETAAAAYLMMAAVIDAFERAGPTARGVELRDALRDTELDTPLGPVSFTETGDLENPVLVIGTIKDGEPVTLP